MARTVPQIVVSVSATNMAVNFRGAYVEEETYQQGQWVTSGEELWECTKTSKKHKPAEGSEFWVLIGSIA